MTDSPPLFLCKPCDPSKLSLTHPQTPPPQTRPVPYPTVHPPFHIFVVCGCKPSLWPITSFLWKQRGSKFKPFCYYTTLILQVSQQVKFPREFVKFLHKAGIPLGSVLRRNRPFHLPGVSAISAPRYDATSRSQAMSDTPEHSNGVITTQCKYLH